MSSEAQWGHVTPSGQRSCRTVSKHLDSSIRLAMWTSIAGLPRCVSQTDQTAEVVCPSWIVAVGGTGRNTTLKPDMSLTDYPVIPNVRKLFSAEEVRRTHRRRSLPRCG